jgi:hypothetical protein
MVMPGKFIFFRGVSDLVHGIFYRNTPSDVAEKFMVSTRSFKKQDKTR